VRTAAPVNVAVGEDVMEPLDLMLVKVGQAEPSDLHGRVDTAARVTITSDVVLLGQSVPQTMEYVVVALWLCCCQHGLTTAILFEEDLPERNLRGQGDGAEGKRLELHDGDLFCLKGMSTSDYWRQLVLEGHE
jgi:hypothetical protein